MKKRFIKTIFILFLCFIILTGCGIVSTPETTPTPEPTPAEPTPTPIPYGEVLDITIGYDAYFSDNSRATNITNISKTLLERFSLRVVDYANADSLASPDAVFYVIPPDISITTFPEENVIRAKAGKTGKEKYNSINYLENLDRLPVYSTLFSKWDSLWERFTYGEDISQKDYEYALPATGTVNTPTTFWIYNTEWFSKNGYNIPESMESLIQLLILHKSNKDNEAQPILMCDGSGDMVTGLFASYGIDYRFSTGICDVIEENNGEYSFTLSDQSVIDALDVLKLIEDNSLARDKYINYENIDASDFSQYAVYYYSATANSNDSVVIDEINKNAEKWGVFENGLSVDDTVYLQTYPYTILNTYSNHEPGNFLIIDTGREEVINRLLDFVDWCCTDEGIIACNYGIEGKDFIFNNDGTIRLLKDQKAIIPAALRTTLATYAGSVLRKYTDNNDASMYKKAELAFKDKQTVYFNNPRSILVSSLIDSYSTNYGMEIRNAATSYFEDYISGTKTAEDFDNYLAELEALGLGNIIEEIQNAYNDLYNKINDYIPDSLK